MPGMDVVYATTDTQRKLVVWCHGLITKRLDYERAGRNFYCFDSLAILSQFTDFVFYSRTFSAPFNFANRELCI